ncbi:tetratricopeptide repeat protein [Virgisporangium aurantiacum]|uniref:tetratricopeptide repeat protein n=1 Tax=Virgisporangium aurantiacum TaxID=175570 RepID=UPI0035714017
MRSSPYGPAGDHLQHALILFRHLGNRTGEAWALDSLGALYTRLGQPGRATEHHQQALTIFRETGDRFGEAWALNGLGEAAHTAGRVADALTHHTAAADNGDRDERARAHTGLGHAHHTLGNHTLARHHYQHALALYTDLDLPEADRIRTLLAALDNSGAERREHHADECVDRSDEQVRRGVHRPLPGLEHESGGGQGDDGDEACGQADQAEPGGEQDRHPQPGQDQAAVGGAGVQHGE